jgi:hypothetical protein
MNATKKMLIALAMVAPIVIVGCGGGDSNDNSQTADTTAVPESAGTSVAAFMSFLSSLASNDETSEPLTVSDSFAVPADETNDPQPVT